MTPEPPAPYYSTSIGNFYVMCRHCRETKERHAEGKCLFDVTSWAPMTAQEFQNYWRTLTDFSKIYAAAVANPYRAEFIREVLKQQQFGGSHDA